MQSDRIEKVISGGQTGVDRSGLDAAMEAGIPVGGCCPKGRRAEDGAIPDCYPLVELPSADYRRRTRRNVVDSDGTLILNVGWLKGGTALTARYCQEYRKPCLVLQLDADPDPDAAAGWIAQNKVRILNIAGPRESEHPGLHALALEFLRAFLSAVKGAR
ncbi:putative molybdenum carrier protein [Geomonas sp. RF6]|uniref:putative molybdenum carrier protein n=1 Tax=Geomonas sp. RF6 TaxID=2897342 RepID=UPI001E3A273C|nr:putative molybdenum carrier protein [Geomonas sp. RF6]UFS71146.1 putative molybdenum carrier protein [Geomonas sp. RF6]